MLRARAWRGGGSSEYPRCLPIPPSWSSKRVKMQCVSDSDWWLEKKTTFSPCAKRALPSGLCRVPLHVDPWVMQSQPRLRAASAYHPSACEPFINRQQKQECKRSHLSELVLDFDQVLHAAKLRVAPVDQRTSEVDACCHQHSFCHQIQHDTTSHGPKHHSRARAHACPQAQS